MARYYILPAHVIENLDAVVAQGERAAAKKAAERDGISAGRVAVIAVESVIYKTLESSTVVDAVD
jgi:hypothetical protein